MASSSKLPSADKRIDAPVGNPKQISNHNDNIVEYSRLLHSNRYQPLALERCHKDEDGNCEIIRIVGLWDKVENRWVKQSPEYVNVIGEEWCGDPSELRPAFGSKPQCHGPIVGPPGKQGEAGKFGPVGDMGQLGYPGTIGPPGPEIACDDIEECGPNEFETEIFCSEDQLKLEADTNSVGAALVTDTGESPFDFDPRLIPDSAKISIDKVLSYSNATNCCQELKCSLPRTAILEIEAFSNSTGRVVVWGEDEAGNFIPELFGSAEADGLTNHITDDRGQPDPASSSDSSVVFSSYWKRKLYPGDYHEVSIWIGFTDLDLDTGGPDDVVRAFLNEICLNCSVSTIGPA